MAILVSYKIRAEIKINTISQKLCRICLFNSSSLARQRASPCFLNFSGIRETKKQKNKIYAYGTPLRFPLALRAEGAPQ